MCNIGWLDFLLLWHNSLAYDWGVFSIGSFAQQRTITGTVTGNSDGLPMVGVNVIVQGTTQGTTTDVDGNYSLNVPADATNLVYSFVGYRSQGIAVGNRSAIDIQLEEDIVALDEIVVTAFGVEREKKAITYSAQNVDTENLAKARELNVANSLAGKVAGLDMIKSSSGVGSAGVIKTQLFACSIDNLSTRTIFVW